MDEDQYQDREYFKAVSRRADRLLEELERVRKDYLKAQSLLDCLLDNAVSEYLESKKGEDDGTRPD